NLRLDPSNLRFRISALQCRTRPISKFPASIRTHEIGGLVRAAGSLPSGDLRIWTERTSPVDNGSDAMRRNNLCGRHAFLHPLLEWADRVERVRPGAATTMAHAG